MFTMLQGTVACALALLVACSTPSDVSLTICPQPGQPQRVTVEATGSFLPQTALSLRLPGQYPVAGLYTRERNTLHFTPRFPLLAGEQYQATLRLPGKPERTAFYTVPRTEAHAPRLSAIHPTTNALPANHLKFYLHFSELMEQGDIFRHLRLLDVNGTAVADPFRETELWSRNGKRLTLWLHPGRQKTGVNLNVELGPVLTRDRQYTLLISGNWKSQAGQPLGADVKKTFHARAPDRVRLDPKKWTIHPPSAGTRQPLRLEFGEPLDWALLHTQISVAGVEGAALVTTDEHRWLFTPTKPWIAGANAIIVNWELEDLAGNNLVRPFEVDLTQPPDPANATPRRLPFDIQ